MLGLRSEHASSLPHWPRLCWTSGIEVLPIGCSSLPLSGAPVDPLPPLALPWPGLINLRSVKLGWQACSACMRGSDGVLTGDTSFISQWDPFSQQNFLPFNQRGRRWAFASRDDLTWGGTGCAWSTGPWKVLGPQICFPFLASGLPELFSERGSVSLPILHCPNRANKVQASQS